MELTSKYLGLKVQPKEEVMHEVNKHNYNDGRKSKDEVKNDDGEFKVLFIAGTTSRGCNHDKYLIHHKQDLNMRQIYVKTSLILV